MNKKSLLQNLSLIRIVLVLWVVSSVFTLLLFLDIDQIIHHDLYAYGLQFSMTWASHYWGDARAIYVLMIIPAALSISVLGYDLVNTRRNSKKRSERQVLERSKSIACSKCKRRFKKALVMLDVTQKPPKNIRVCPYCHVVLNGTEEKDSVTIHIAEPEKVTPSTQAGARKAGSRGS